jgi:RNA polymerase sigma-70 factor (ECF subfamily)
MNDSFAEFLVRLRARDGDAAREIFQRFTGQLVALAARRLDGGLRAKVDPEDVVQSAYKSYFRRYAEGPPDVGGWDGLWGLLAVITVRKCSDRATHHRAQRRDGAREAASPAGGSEGAPWPDAPGREPTPLEAAVLAETVDQLLAGLDDDDRPVVELSLQGYTTREISERLGRAERTVRLVREYARHRLERMQRETD